MDTSAAQLNKKEHIQRFQPRGLDRKEITGDDFLLVVPQEGAPATPLLASFGCGRDTPSLEKIPNSRTPNVKAQLAQFALQLAIAPGWVLLRETEDERFEVWINGRAAERRFLREGPLASNEITMPLE